MGIGYCAQKQCQMWEVAVGGFKFSEINQITLLELKGSQPNVGNLITLTTEAAKMPFCLRKYKLPGYCSLSEFA